MSQKYFIKIKGYNKNGLICWFNVRSLLHYQNFIKKTLNCINFFKKIMTKLKFKLKKNCKTNLTFLNENSDNKK